MKSFFLIATQSGYKYLYSYQKKDLLVISDILFKIIETINNSGLISSKKPLPLEIFAKLNCTEKIFSYNLKKFLFLSKNGYFDTIDMKSRFLEMTESQVQNRKKNTIVFEMTEDCNLSCNYCIYGKLYSHYSQRTDSQLSFDKIKLILDNYIDRNKILGELSFYGGEPLMSINEIKKTVEYAKTFSTKSSAFSYRMTTNGLLINKYIDYLHENNFCLMISLDGTEQDNIHRIFKNGKQSYSKIMKNIFLIKEKYPEYFKSNVEFGTVVHSLTDIDEMRVFFKETFGKTPILSEVSKVGVRVDKKAEFKEIQKSIETRLIKDSNKKNKEFSNSNFNLHFNNYNQLIKKSDKASFFPTGTCTPSEKGIFITVSGKVLQCESIAHKYSIGSISENKLNLKNKEFTANFNKHMQKAISKCEKCYYARICGQCIYMQFNEKEELNCKSFMGYNKFKEYLKENIEYMETEIN